MLNDAVGVRTFFQAMARQTLLPTELVIIDGGSDDGTWELLKDEAEKNDRSYHLIVGQDIGCNVARGRDLAIEKANHDVIVSTDVGCEWDPQWFEELLQPMKDDPSVDVVIGSWAVRLNDAKSDWARVEFARRWPFRLEATPDSLGINRAIVYKKTVWKTVGGYPQDLTLAADDVVFDMIIRKPEFGFKFAAAPKVRCYWERHETLKQFCKEERRNFFGAGEAQIWSRHFVLVTGRMLVEMVLILAAVILAFVPGGFWFALVALLMALASVCLRIRSLWPAIERLKEMKIGFPLIRVLWFDYQTKIWGMRGYAKGWINGARQCLETRRRLWGTGN